MVWLSIVSLMAGALLAQRFKISVLVPATIAIAVVAMGVGLTQANGFWSTTLVVAAASVCVQAGYFAGMLVQHGLTALLARRSASFSDTPSARDVSVR
jgi:uncharacterized membrane protein